MFSATDIASFLACRHTETLARAESKHEITKPFFRDPSVELLQKLVQHEKQYLRELTEKDGLAITQIDVNGCWANAVAETIRALREGVDAVYQATFLDGTWGGRSDFLIRVDKPSVLGAWSYEVVETKLARSTKQLEAFCGWINARVARLNPQFSTKWVFHLFMPGLVQICAEDRFPILHMEQSTVLHIRKICRIFQSGSPLGDAPVPAVVYADRREPTIHPCLRPAVQIRALASNRLWRQTTIRRVRVLVRLAARSR
jgi:hypothetical protein